MEPVEVLEVVTNEENLVIELRGSQQLLDSLPNDYMPEVPRTVKQPEMIQLMPPTID